MWFPVILLIAGVAVVTGTVDHEHAWEKENEYEYHVHSRTVVGLDKLKRQYTGLQIEAKLIVQVKSPQKLQVKLSDVRYTRLHTTLVDGPDTNLPEHMLDYRVIPMLEKPFEVTMKHGVIRDLLVDRDIPTWQLNLLKSIMSQLQIDTQGENAVEIMSAQIPDDENSPVIFTAIEDSVSGKCEVLYEILPLHPDVHRVMPDKILIPDLLGKGYHYEVKKIKNYEKCLERQIYHHGLEDPWLRKRKKLYKRDKFISELSTTQMLISGNLKRFTIQSVVTKSHVSVRPDKIDPFLGNVHSILKLILKRRDKISSPMFDSLESINLESTGNLMYTYNNPFSDSENPILPSIGMNSEQMQSSERTSSSEKMWDDHISSFSSSSDEGSPKRMAMRMDLKNPVLPYMAPIKVEQMKDLINEIAVAIHYSNDTRLRAVEHIVCLKNSLRIMSLKQIAELKEQLRNLVINNKDYENTVWSIFRDGLVQTGTEPALLTIHNLLKTKKIEGLVAAKVMSQISKYVYKPTKEYVKAFYEMITDPSVMYQTAVNVTAPLAFAEVIRKSYSDTYHPTRSLKRLGPMTLRDIVPIYVEISEIYIPFMADQLKKGLLDNDYAKVQVYIVALGLTGHSKILSIFEPYIEGKEPVSKFHRLLMVSSLSTLSILKPELIGPIFYKIYSNVKEDHRIRCMSIHRYIITNPPLIMLERIAKFTNDDLDEDVNSVVKSTINSLANTKRPELEDLSNKARSVKHLLNPKEFSKLKSQGYYKDLDYWFIKGLSVQTIGDNRILPSYLSVGVNSAFDFFGLPTLKAGYIVSNVKELFYNSKYEETSNKLLKESHIEKLMQELYFKSEELEKLEGNVFIDTVHNLLIYPFDREALKKMSSQLKDFFKKDQELDLLSVDNHEIMLSFPIESGLPFLYTLDSPMILKLKAEMRNNKLLNLKKIGNLNVYVANKVQKRFGFIAPYDSHNYIAGVHVNRILDLPLEYEVELDSTQQKLDISTLKIGLKTQTSPINVLHLSTIPFTTQKDLHELECVFSSRNTHVILTERKHKIILEKDLISLQVESDSKEIEENLEENDILSLLLKLQEIPDGHYKQLDVIMNHEQLAKSVLDMNIIHEKIAIDNAVQLYDPESQIMFPLKHVKLNSEKRRKEVATGLSKDLRSGDVHILDINLNLPELEKQQVFTVGWMDSNIDKKSKVYLYWNSQMLRMEKPTSEVCYTHEIQYSPDTPLNFEHMKKHAPKDKVRAELQYGESCSRGNKIVVEASMSRSDRIKDLLESSKVVKQCWKEMEEGHNALHACQQATELAQMKNQLDVSYKGPIRDIIKKIIKKISDFISHLFPHSRIKLTDSEDSDEKGFDIKMTLSPSEIDPSVSLDSPQADVTFPNMEQTDSEMQELLKENIIHRRKERRASCTFDKDMLLTFDKLLYPVKLGTCKHVLMTTYPQKNTQYKESNVDFVALIRNHSDGAKMIAIMVDDHLFEMDKIGDNTTILIDGVPIKLSHKGYQLREDSGKVLEIHKLPDGSIEVDSGKSDFRILFDGERIQLFVSDIYRNAVRGLCGNYDSDPSTDFLTPQNCLMKMPEVFTATYALTEDCLQEDILENKRKAKLTQCRELPMSRPNNVINDIEAGRLPTHSERWGYHNDNLKRKYNFDYDSKKSSSERKDLPDNSNLIYRTKVVLEDEEICFTIKPVPMCRHGTKSREKKMKEFGLYCQPRNEESLLIKRRIEQGANPDFTRKPLSRSHTFQVPIVCNHHIMWLYLAFLLIFGAAIADHNHAWETGNEYHYLIKSRTLTGLNGLEEQYSGIYMRGKLTIQVKSSDTLQAVVSEMQHASVNEILLDISVESTKLEFRKLSLSGKPFEIKLKRGVIRDMLIDQSVPTWEVNLLKSIVSQLQIDTEGENAIASRSTMVPNDNQSFSEFKVMEDSVGGKCEVLYNISSVMGDSLSISLPHLHKDGQHFVVAKTKNYSRCEQRVAYHSGIIGKMNWKPGSTDGFLSRSSSNYIIISGNLKRFTIQSSTMTNQMLINSHNKYKFDNTYSAIVYSGMNLTLDRINQISNPMHVSNNLVPTGNLVYTYNNPFSSQRKPRRPSVSQSSLAAQSSENHNSNSSSQENHSDDDNFKSEEHDYFQPKPKLDEAPESPLLPYFIGYNGMSILNSGENYTLIAKRLIALTFRFDHFGTEHNVNDRYIEALERFTILVKLIRTMNVEQIAEIANEVPKLYGAINTLSESDFDLSQQNVWSAFSCAVANAGTGPALITIKNWIKSGKLKGIQAAQIISKIPKSVLTPTTEYVAAFFEMITDEKVTKQRFLNTTAPLLFAELARYTQSNKLSIYYPVYSFGRMVPKHDNELLETYIPYMATQLRKAIEEGDSHRIQTYIMALGNFGHPKILSVFEPYLEGTIPITKFQRLMMVISLSKLTESYPRVVRSVALKIYLNLKEAYELRCVAVHIIIKTNPSLIILQRMAEFTNQDQDQHVNSVVKTSIESLINLEQSEWKDLAEKARIASKLLNPNISDDNYSRSFFTQTKIASLNIAQTGMFQIIGSDDTNTPKGAYIDILQSYGGLNLPLTKMAYTVSSIEDLKQKWLDVLLGDRPWMPQDKTREEWMIETIIEKLGIEPENAEQLEGNFFVDSAFSSGFYPFDNHTLEEFINILKMYRKSISRTRLFVSEYQNKNDVNHYDITLGFPTETGLPFIYTLAVPKITSINRGGSIKIKATQNDSFVELAGTGYIVSSEKIQSRIGFVTPFEHRHYIAGVDINTHIAIPVGLNFTTRCNSTFQLKLQPHNNPHSRMTITRLAIHHSVVPYTSRQDILQLLEFSNETRLVYTKEPNEIQISLGNLTLSARSDVIDSDMSQKKGLEGLINLSAIFYLNLGAHYRRFDATLYPVEAQINLTRYVQRTNRSSEATIPAIIDKRPNSRERGAQFLDELTITKDNRSDNSVTTSTMYDISVLANNNYYVLTFVLGESRDKLQTLSYENVQSLDGEVFWEFCSVNSIVGLSQYNHLNVEKAIEKIPNYEFNAEMRHGSCANGETIKLKGNLSRTDDVLKKAMKSEIVEECRQQMKQGNIWLPTCQKANELIQQRDLLIMSLETNSNNLYSLANRMILMIKMMISDNNMKRPSMEGFNKYMDVEIKIPFDNNDVNISLNTLRADVSFSLSQLVEDPNVISPNYTLNKLFKEDLEGDMCVLDKTQVVTFDNKIYPLTLGECWHVMMAPYPKRDPNNPEKILDFPYDVRAIVMAREMDDGSKQVWIILGHEEIHLRKLDDRLQVSIVGGDDYDSHFSSHKNYEQTDLYEIYQEDGLIIMHSLQYNIHVVYDGERILLYVHDKYLYTVRGLCGNYDMRSNNDFVTPKNCILTKPEEFAATYALTYQEDCKGPALQNKLKAEQSTCISRSYIPGDVISEREKGRWSYH
ncbi:PREDICTED: vitellogenin-3-like [Trachymyrmex cornetzi]|uniref:vitellogenin-3-like n=1 Tax=Trachymyrmex cornetzi TaxID=471704 RepID=UPI00084EF344|nr:PREDICTED: vitellogenin-3-like [Trachymyrmex cornetzi]